MQTQNVDEYAEKILQRISFLDNPYFNSLTRNEMTLDEFKRTQVQFFFAVDFFSRPMSALIARIPDSKARLEILKNIVEEHGEMEEESFHAHTFKRFLRSIGQPDLDFTNFREIAICPQVRAFNTTIAAACILDQLEVGIACMGIIERMFAQISALIAKVVVAREWVNEKDLVHYDLHAELDIKHAADFFNIIEPAWDNPEKQHFIKQGLELGAYAFYRMYSDLINYKGT